MIRKALLFSLALQPAQFLLQFAYGVITARLMSPDEKGVFGGAVALFSLVQMLQGFGASSLLVRSAPGDEAIVRRTLALLSATSVAAGLLAWLGAPAAAALTSEPRLVAVLHVLALSLLVGPLEIVCGGLLMRELRFGQLAVCGLAKTAATCAVGLWLVGAGHSYLGQAWGMVAGTFCYTLFTLAFTHRLLPRRLDWRLPRSMLRSLWHILGSQTGTTLADRLQTATLLRLQGSANVGTYGLAASVCDIARQSLSDPALRVFQPAWAQSMRSPSEFALLLGRSLELFSAILFPAYLVLIALAEPVVLALYGTAWSDAARMLQWLAGAAAVSTFSFGFVKVLLAANRTGLLLLLQIGLSAVGYASFAAGALIGMEAVGASRFLMAVLTGMVGWYVFARLAAVDTRRLASHFGPGLLIGVVAGCVAWLGSQAIPLAPAALRAAVGAGAASIAWLAMLALTRHPLYAEIRHGLSRTTARIRGAG